MMDGWSYRSVKAVLKMDTVEKCIDFCKQNQPLCVTYILVPKVVCDLYSGPVHFAKQGNVNRHYNQEFDSYLGIRIGKNKVYYETQ